MVKLNTAEELADIYETEYYTDVITGGQDKRMYLYYQLINSLKQADSVDIVVSFLMDTYPQLASIQNHKQQNALHVSLESDALEVYQLLIRYHSPELDVRAADQFGRIPIDIWKRVMEEKREKSCSGFPHQTKKPLVLVTDPFTQHQTCSYPPPRSVRYQNDNDD